MKAKDENKFIIFKQGAYAKHLKVREHLIEAVKELGLEEKGRGLITFLKDIAAILDLDWRTLLKVYKGEPVRFSLLMRINKRYEEWDVESYLSN